MKIHDPDIKAAHDRWWRDVTMKGDPSRNPNLSTEAFIAGWTAAQDSVKATTAEISAACAAALEAARDASRDAAWDAARVALATTKKQIQQSALALVHRMIEAR